MLDRLDELKERLLRAGVHPGRAARYVGELRDHLDDLAAEGTESGLSDIDARHRAIARLGNVEDLARPMFADQRFHSWAGARPWAVFVVAPILAQAAMMAAAAFALAATTAPGTAPAWFSTASEAARYVLGGAFPVGVAWVLAIIALRQRSRPFWPALGIGGAIGLGAILHLPVSLPAPGQPGTIAIALALPSLLHLLALLGLTAAPFLLTYKKNQI